MKARPVCKVSKCFVSTCSLVHWQFLFGFLGYFVSDSFRRHQIRSQHIFGKTAHFVCSKNNSTRSYDRAWNHFELSFFLEWNFYEISMNNIRSVSFFIYEIVNWFSIKSKYLNWQKNKLINWYNYHKILLYIHHWKWEQKWQRKILKYY